MRVKAKMDAGVPGRNWIKPVADRQNKKVWPTLPNGTLVHGGFLIVKYEEYDIPADKYKNVQKIFAKIEVKKGGKNE